MADEYYSESPNSIGDSLGKCHTPDQNVEDNIRPSRHNYKKRKQMHCESSADSGSNYFQSESDSEFEFEEHAYSLPKKIKFSSKNRLSASSIGKSSDAYCGEVKFKLEATNTEPKRSKCNSKNAVMARQNRLKKKKYIQDLEKKNGELQAENERLKQILDRRTEEIGLLKREKRNLQSVIRNSTEIGSLLRCIRQHTDLEVSSSLMKDVTEDAHSTNLTSTSELSVNLASSSKSSTSEEVLVAALLWGMALHTFCQPYKQNTPKNVSKEL